MYKSSKEMVYTDLLDFNTKKKNFFQLQEFFSRQWLSSALYGLSIWIHSLSANYTRNLRLIWGPHTLAVSL